MRVLGYSWVGIATGDFEGTLRFFTETLGLPLARREDDAGFAHLRLPSGQLFEVFGPNSSEYADVHGDSCPVVGFEVEEIGDPMLAMLEVLIIAMMPAMVAVHAWAPEGAKALRFASLVFMGLLAGLTCVVHFSILSLGRQPEFAGRPWTPLVFSFEWPSVAYALDILAWDVFFALSMLFAAPVFSGGRLAAWVRAATVSSGALSLAGLSGVVAGDMQLRNIGIVGYVGVFLVVAALLAVLFYRSTPQEP